MTATWVPFYNATFDIPFSHKIKILQKIGFYKVVDLVGGGPRLNKFTYVWLIKFTDLTENCLALVQTYLNRTTHGGKQTISKQLGFLESPEFFGILLFFFQSYEKKIRAKLPISPLNICFSYIFMHFIC